MKNIILLFFLIITFLEIKSQVNEVSFYPLKEGNVWVYTLYNTQWGTTTKIRKTVSSSMVVNGHKYFKIGELYYRVDSATANVYQYFPSGGCPISPNEKMIDSLKSRIRDTLRADCGLLAKICLDTNLRDVFGNLKRTKHFIYLGGGKLFAKDIGILETYGGSGINLFSEILKGCVLDGVVYGDTSMLLGINQINSEIPQSFSLFQNYPNPFNPVTKIKFSIPAIVGNDRDRTVLLIIYDALGREIHKIFNQNLQPGTYEAEWDASEYPSGVYYYRLESDKFTESKKMVLIR